MRVLIFGWGGATRRALQPLVHHYAARGLTADIVLTDVNALMFRPDKWRAGVARHLDAEAGRAGQPLLVHLFSNTGFLSFCELASQASRRSLPFLAGVRLAILECGPGIPVPLESAEFAELWTRASLPLLRLGEGDPALSQAPRRTALIRLVWRLYHRLYRGHVRQMQDAMRWFLECPMPVPYHFLASHSDQVIPPRYVQEVESVLRTRGARTHLQLWDGSRHVGLPRALGEAYFAHLDRILAER